MILCVTAAIHLLLDASQIKLANGVHFLAPFSWKLLNYGFYWPESIVTVLQTASGILFLSYNWSKIDGSDLTWPGLRPTLFICLTALAYIAGPIAFLNGPKVADNHFIETLRSEESRVGLAIELDRVAYEKIDKGGSVVTFAGESLFVDESDFTRSGTVSVRGRFVEDDTVALTTVHYHWPLFRDTSSIVGLLAISVYWLRSALSLRRQRRKTPR